MQTLRVSLLGALLWMLTLGVDPIYAQAPFGETSAVDEPLTIEQLRSKLESLQVELQQEREFAKRQAHRGKEELQSLREQRRELADELLSAQLETERKAKQLKSLRDEASDTSVERDEVAHHAAGVARSVRDAAEQLRIHLREVPGNEGAVESLADTAAKLSSASENDVAHVETELDILFRLLSESHRAATLIGVREATIYTADGSQQKVKLLNLGAVRFAYETVEDGRVGLALSSPRDANGFRWSENLTPQQQSQVREAIAAVSSKSTGIALFPIDPLGNIQPESLNQEETFWARVAAGGLIMYPLFAIALVALLLILERTYFFYVSNGLSTGKISSILDACRDVDMDQALEICRHGRGTVYRVMAACLARSSQGSRAMEDSIQEQLLHEMPRLQRFMGGIATLAAVAPLLGLLGTVTGIIQTFGVIRAFGNANPSLMAGGISEALMTTATGLVIAVPILIMHSMLRGRSDQIVADAERYAANLLTMIVHPPSEHWQRSSSTNLASRNVPAENDLPGEEVSVD